MLIGLLVALLAGAGLLALDLYGFSLGWLASVAHDGLYLYVVGACVGLLYTLSVAAAGWWRPRGSSLGRLAGFTVLALASMAAYVLGLQLPLYRDTLAAVSLALAILALVVAAGGFGGIPGTTLLALALLLLVPAPAWLLRKAGAMLYLLLSVESPAGLGWGLAGLAALLTAMPGFIAATAGRGDSLSEALAAYAIGLAAASLIVIASVLDPGLHPVIAGSPVGMAVVFASGLLAAASAAPRRRTHGRMEAAGSPATIALAVLVLAGLHGLVAHYTGGEGVAYYLPGLLSDPASTLPQSIVKPSEGSQRGGGPGGIPLPCSGSTFTVEGLEGGLWGCVEAYESSVYIEPLPHRLEEAGLNATESWGVWLNGPRYAELAAVNTSRATLFIGSGVYAVKALRPGGLESIAYVRVTVAGASVDSVTSALEELTPTGALKPPPQPVSERLLLAAGTGGLTGLALIAAYVLSRLARGRGGPGGG